MARSLLLQFYDRLPERREGEDSRSWAVRMDEGLKRLKQDVTGRYTEGTLQRLASCGDPAGRRAALLALHLTGSMASNEPVAACLYDDDSQVRQMAADALWALWLRADGEASNRELQRALQQTDPQRALAGLTALVRKSPGFAEAYNQRAILYFQMQEYEKSAADCQKVLQLNPCHFGAAAGLGRCFLQLQLPWQALKAFRVAFRINPHLEGVMDTIRELESAFGKGKGLADG